MVDPGSNRLYMVPGLPSGWVLRESADGPALRRTNTRRGALDFATLMLSRRHGGQVSVHDHDGAVIALYDVRALGKRPWWYQPPRVSAFIGPFALCMLTVTTLLDDSSHAPPWFSVAMLTFAVLWLVAIADSYRADRSHGPLVRAVRLE